MRRRLRKKKQKGIVLCFWGKRGNQVWKISKKRCKIEGTVELFLGSETEKGVSVSLSQEKEST